MLGLYFSHAPAGRHSAARSNRARLHRRSPGGALGCGGRHSRSGCIAARPSNAGQLAHAGYATLLVTSDPVGAAATLRQRPGVRADDIALIGYGSGASSVLATIVEPYALEVAHPPLFRSAIAFGPDCARRYGDWTGSLPVHASGTAGAPHGGAAAPGLYRSATPLLIVGGQGPCRELALYSNAHEYFVAYASNVFFDPVAVFIAENAQYSVVTFPSSQNGTKLTGELTVPDVAVPVPVVIISPGTAGIEGFGFWERWWAQRLRGLGYASLIVDSYMSRHSSWKNHWRIDARTVKSRDLLDARTYLAAQPFARANSIGLLGRSSGERRFSPRSWTNRMRRLPSRSPITAIVSSATARGQVERRRRGLRLRIGRAFRY